MTALQPGQAVKISFNQTKSGYDVVLTVIIHLVRGQCIVQVYGFYKVP
jgi:hypothetical protein